MAIDWNVTVQGTSPTVMPFGKHKGTPLDQVPRDYLQWALKNATLVKPGLRGEIELVLGIPVGTTRNPPEANGGTVSFKTRDGKQVSFKAKTIETVTEPPTSPETGNGQTEVQRLNASLANALRDVRDLEATIVNLRGDIIARDRTINAQRAELDPLRARIATLQVQMSNAQQFGRNGTDNPTDMERFRRILKGVFSLMSRKHHPDVGGTVERQTVVNDFYRELVKKMEGR